MSTDKRIEHEFGSFEDEVLDAGWLPPVPELQSGPQESRADAKTEFELEFDADTFLSKVYRNQA